jgi:hypothetical protein
MPPWSGDANVARPASAAFLGAMRTETNAGRRFRMPLSLLGMAAREAASYVDTTCLRLDLLAADGIVVASCIPRIYSPPAFSPHKAHDDDTQQDMQREPAWASSVS